MMKGAALLASFLLASCSPEPQRAFPVGLAGPVSARVAAEAARLGLETSDAPPPGASVESAGAETAADWSVLRYRAARAALKGGGLFFRLPPAAAGRDILDEPEQWQAILRALREPAAMKPVLEAGRPSDSPFAAATGIESASWSYRGRRYVLLVNVTDGPARLDEEALAPWRSLFEARSDPRNVLPPCGAGRCLPPGTALWLESRPL